MLHICVKIVQTKTNLSLQLLSVQFSLCKNHIQKHMGKSLKTLETGSRSMVAFHWLTETAQHG